jgi:pentapeptide repeat protein
MNKDESLALLKEGKKAWNDWANEMLAKKNKFIKNGNWQEDKLTANQEMKEWLSDASVDYSGHTFSAYVDFSGFIFPYIANFRNVIFSGDADFFLATFSGDALFNCAQFNGDAGFFAATFSGDASFGDATFSGDASFGDAIFSGRAITASFDNATFSGDAWFSCTQFNGLVSFNFVIFKKKVSFIQANFESLAMFIETTFENYSSFEAIQGHGLLSFQRAEFNLVPDFTQTHFTEAPQFDGTDFSNALTGWSWIRNKDTSSNTASYWRSLKRLAIQGHDHERELLFFAEEIKSQRGKQDKAFPEPFNLVATHEKTWSGGTRYWLGLLYELLSDFGRSVWRPLLWWFVSVFLFANFYLGQHKTAYEPKSTNTQLSCLNGSQDNPVTAARFLSIYNGLVIAGFGRSEKLSQSYACLYGGGQDQPVTMPDKVVCAGIIQSIFSAVMLFLLLLALRNKFKIK